VLLEKFNVFVINPKQVNKFKNYGVKTNRKYGTRQIFIVTLEKDESSINIMVDRRKLRLATVY